MNWIQNNLEIYRNVKGTYGMHVSGTKKSIFPSYTLRKFLWSDISLNDQLGNNVNRTAELVTKLSNPHISIRRTMVYAITTAMVERFKGAPIARLRFTPREIIYNMPQPSIMLHLKGLSHEN